MNFSERINECLKYLDKYYLNNDITDTELLKELLHSDSDTCIFNIFRKDIQTFIRNVNYHPSILTILTKKITDIAFTRPHIKFHFYNKDDKYIFNLSERLKNISILIFKEYIKYKNAPNLTELNFEIIAKEFERSKKIPNNLFTILKKFIEIKYTHCLLEIVYATYPEYDYFNKIIEENFDDKYFDYYDLHKQLGNDIYLKELVKSKNSYYSIIRTETLETAIEDLFKNLTINKLINETCDYKDFKNLIYGIDLNNNKIEWIGKKGDLILFIKELFSDRSIYKITYQKHYSLILEHFKFKNKILNNNNIRSFKKTKTSHLILNIIEVFKSSLKNSAHFKRKKQNII